MGSEMCIRDRHSRDIHEELYPYVYYPGLPNSEISAKAREVAMVLDMKFMVRSTATTGAYNYAAISGVPSLLIERGGSGLCRREDIDAYKNDLHNILCKLELLCSPQQQQKHTPVDVTDVIYLETDKAGCWFSSCRCGDKIKQGDKLGYLTDLFGNTITVYNAEQDGIILYHCSALAAPKGTILVTYGKVKNN